MSEENNQAGGQGPVAWMTASDWSAAPHVTADKGVALAWKRDSREVTPLYAAPAPSASPAALPMADAVAHIERKAEEYANEYGYGVAGTLCFDSQVKMDHYTSLTELADELRELAAQPAADAPKTVDDAWWQEFMRRIDAATSDGAARDAAIEWVAELVAASPAHPDRQGVALSEQEAFEAAMTAQFGEGEDFTRDAEGCYTNSSWHDAWIGWQASRASSSRASGYCENCNCMETGTPPCASSSRAEVERDAERYRRIRNGPHSDRHGDVYAMVFMPDGDAPIHGAKLDSIIDAALAAAEAPNGEGK